MRRSPRITVLFLAAALVVIAAGCGGGSKSSAPPTTEQTTTQQATTTGSGGSDFASAKNCIAFAALGAKIATAMTPTTSGGTQAAFQAESRELQAFADAAPSNIKADFQTFATAFSGYLKALQKAGYTIGSITQPTPAQIAAITKATKLLSTPKMRSAEQHLSAWVQNNCK